MEDRGFYSARFSGEGATDEKNNEKLLGLLKGYDLDSRTAKFVSAIAVNIQILGSTWQKESARDL